MTMSLKAELRDAKTKSTAKRLRASGKIPAVVYGRNVPSTPIAISAKELTELLRRKSNHLIELELPNHGKQPVLLTEVHRDKVNGHILHVDFHQVDMNEPVKAEVAINLTGDAKGVREGGVLSQLLTHVQVRCLSDRIPDEIRVDVTELGIGDSLTAGELQLPEGVELQEDADAVVLTILGVRKDEAEEPAQAAEAEAAKTAK